MYEFAAEHFAVFEVVEGSNGFYVIGHTRASDDDFAVFPFDIRFSPKEARFFCDAFVLPRSEPCLINVKPIGLLAEYVYTVCIAADISPILVKLLRRCHCLLSRIRSHDTR